MYRDRHEQCPRCSIALVTSGSVRACSQCGGHWVTADVLREMAEAMVIPARPIEIVFVPDSHPRLSCPQCESPMGTWKVHGVPIDRCNGHGLWFDRAELETVLYATSGQEPVAHDEAGTSDLGGVFAAKSSQPARPSIAVPPELRPEPIANEVDALAQMLETATKRA